MPHKKIPLIERFVKKVWIDPETGCWIFTGKISKKGYGQIGDENGKIKRRAPGVVPTAERTNT